MATVRFEELEHPSVRAAGLAGEDVRDEVRQVVVADAHRVGVAERADGDLGCRPRPKPGECREPGIRLRERQVDDRLEPGRATRDAADEVGPSTLDAERVIRVIGERGKDLGEWREQDAQFRRAWRRLAVGAVDRSERGSE